MHVFLKTLIFVGFASAIFLSPLLADGAKDNLHIINMKSDSTHVEIVTSDFYFPEFDATVAVFWADLGVLTHTCSASSWLGGTANASCEDNEECECSSNLFVATCDCSTP